MLTAKQLLQQVDESKNSDIIDFLQSNPPQWVDDLLHAIIEQPDHANDGSYLKRMYDIISQPGEITPAVVHAAEDNAPNKDLGPSPTSASSGSPFDKFSNMPVQQAGAPNPQPTQAQQLLKQAGPPVKNFPQNKPLYPSQDAAQAAYRNLSANLPQ